MIKKLFKVVILTALVVSVSSSALAQNASPAPGGAEPVDEVKDLAFPIEDLDGCEDYKACMTYCDDPVNNAVCVDFAKKNGFYKDDPVLAPTDDFLAKAKDVLGCDSATSCATFCGTPQNYDACNAFAKSQGVIGGYVEEIEDDSVIFDEAKNRFGCSDTQSCQTFCDNPANADACDKFADEEGLLGGNVPDGPGGCTTEGTCQSFCSDPANFNECSGFAPDGGNFTGPGGCNSKEACRTYCEENPKACRSYAPGSNGVYVPAVCPSGENFGPGGVCTPNDKIQEAVGCAQGGAFWSGTGCIVNFDEVPSGVHPNVGGAYYQPRPEMGNCSTPGSCYDFCKENPGKCASFNASSERPKDGYIPSLYYTPGTDVKFEPKAAMGNCDSPGACYDYCKENPGKCGGFDSKAPRPVDTYMPGTYYTPPTDYTYFTPPATSFYVTPFYYTPPAGSTYSTPSYYTPGMYSTPSYYTPPIGSNYSTPSYYTPGTYYPTPANGQYPTPSYTTPTYYTPPILASYTTPTYYTPSQYTTPTYYTPPTGSNYTTPSYNTPPAYTTPKYYTPYSGGTYTTPVYYTPPAGSNYITPTYSSPSYYYPTPGSTYTSPASYTSPSYYSPSSYPTPGSYPTPSNYLTPGTDYSSYYSPENYPTPGSYSYPTPSSGYSTPESYSTPSYGTPSYGTPSYDTPSYGTPESYPTPSVQGASTKKTFLEQIWYYLFGN